MSFPKLSLVLFVAACGGGGGDGPIVLVDGAGGDGVITSSNSRNDMVLVSFPDMGNGPEMAVALTSTDDSPDNQAAPLALAAGSNQKLAGEMGVGGDHSDEYFERDTFLLHTGADVNELTIRLDWDGGASDHDYVLFEEPAAGTTDLVVVSSGTRISNVKNEFETVPVKSNTNYWLWSGVYHLNADDGSAGGAAPTLPSGYDFSVYPANITSTSVGACNFTELADGTNDLLSDGVPMTNKAEVSGQTLTTNTAVYCGKINKGHFVADPMDPTVGTVDVDNFSLAVNLETPVKVTLVGTTAGDQTALAALSGVEYLVLNDQLLYYARGFFENTHGVLTATLPLSSTTDMDMTSPTFGQVVGPKQLAIVAANGAAITTDISYKIEIAADVPDTRGPRITATANLTEGHDN